MKIVHRVAYYLGGFSIGLIFLVFFIKGSDTQIPSCDYLPNARVLKSIRKHGYSLSAKAKENMAQLQLDTVALNTLFKEGDVVFSKSETHKEPCKVFYIQSSSSQPRQFAAVLNKCDDDYEIERLEKLD
ncbi:MAG: hypothetical protein CL868_20940 [Cytophagaceae bacterium]|nr:hypothetical protein [Cytophagaceae bacterium]|tara:strand:+ start:243 stop:629 length:387 start_codon:yes stop_codon:yes gene_type:complete